MNKEPILEARLQRQWAARAGAGVTSANIRSLHTVSTSGPCLAFIPYLFLCIGPHLLSYGPGTDAAGPSLTFLCNS